MTGTEAGHGSFSIEMSYHIEWIATKLKAHANLNEKPV
jgi:hypothetical protein